MNTAWWMPFANHAMEFYAGALLVLWLAVTFTYHAHVFDTEGNPDGHKRWLITNILVMSVAGGLFSAIAYLLQNGNLTQADAVFSAAVRLHASPLVMQYFHMVTHFGDTLTLTLICIAVVLALLWRKQVLLATGSLLTIAGNGMVNVSLKDIFERLRPLNPYGLPADSWSFPSGHSSGSVATYGLLAYLTLRLLPVRYHLPALLLGTSIAFTTGCSRVFLQYHYASDVVAGLMSGLLWLMFCISLMELLRMPPAQPYPLQDKG